MYIQIITRIVQHRLHAFRYTEGTCIPQLEKTYITHPSVKNQIKTVLASQELLKCIQDWISYNAVLEAKRVQPAQLLRSQWRLRIHQKIPSPITVPEDNFLKSVLKGLSKTHINWQASSQADSLAHMKRVLRELVTELCLWEGYRDQFLEAQEGFKCLLMEVVQLIQGSPNWRAWKPWLNLTFGKDDDDAALQCYEELFKDDQAGILLSVTHSQLLQKQKEKLFKLFKNLHNGLKEAGLDVKLGNTSKGLHPAISSPLEELIQTCIKAQEDLNHAVEQKPSTPLIAPEDISMPAENLLQLHYANEDDLLELYSQSNGIGEDHGIFHSKHNAKGKKKVKQTEEMNFEEEEQENREEQEQEEEEEEQEEEEEEQEE